MSRFKMEINGMLGEWWKKNAEKEVEKLLARADEDIEIEEGGAAKWKSNNRYVPSDVAEMLEYGNYKPEIFSAEKTMEARDKQIEESIKKYKAMKHEPDEEEIAEMTNAFGKGTVVVDILSGREYAL